MEKIAGVVILYQPNRDLWVRISTYLPFLDILYVIDNSPTDNTTLFPNDIVDNTKIIYISQTENIGIAHALNIACTKSMGHQYKWLLTMDQDSYFEPEVLRKYLACIANYEEVEKVGIFGTSYNTLNHLDICQYQEVEHLITSGSIINLSLFSMIGNFDENLFIDGVDQEFCFRTILKGYKVMLLPNISIKHELGQNESFRSLKNGRKTNRSLHSPIRMYYMVRNHLYLRKKYIHLFKNDLNETRKDIFVRLKNNFLYRKDRLKLLTFLSKALIDFKRNRMNKYAS